MAKKSMKEAAAAGTSVFEQLTNENARGAKDVQDVQNAKGAKDTNDTKKAADKMPLERLNLRLPADIKEYLTVAAAKQSIEQKRPVSLTEYLCDLIRADMEKNK